MHRTDDQLLCSLCLLYLEGLDTALGDAWKELGMSLHASSALWWGTPWFSLCNPSLGYLHSSLSAWLSSLSNLFSFFLHILSSSAILSLSLSLKIHNLCCPHCQLVFESDKILSRHMIEQDHCRLPWKQSTWDQPESVDAPTSIVFVVVVFLKFDHRAVHWLTWCWCVCVCVCHLLGFQVISIGMWEDYNTKGAFCLTLCTFRYGPRHLSL